MKQIEPDKIHQIASLSVAGKSSREIEAITGIDHVTVGRKLIKHRDLVEQLQAEFMQSCSEKAVANIKDLINNYDPKEADKDLRAWRIRASMETLRGLGILPSQGTSIMVQNIYNQQNNILSPMLTELITKTLSVSPVSTQDADPAE